MELDQIVLRYAEGIAAIDDKTFPRRASSRTGEDYLPGAKSMKEEDLVKRIDAWWGKTHPNDFHPPRNHELQVPYPGQSSNKCDQVLTSDGNPSGYEWAIEVKYLSLIGDNGKQNDYAVGKALSPYLKDRSIYHDIKRMIENPPARRCAVLAISFTYSEETCKEARHRHPLHADRISHIEQACHKNKGPLSVKPLADFANGILRVQQLTKDKYQHQLFEAWHHPCGGKGVVFGWEVRLEGDSEDWFEGDSEDW